MVMTHKILGLTLVMMLLNPNPLVSDAQVRGVVSKPKMAQIHENVNELEPSTMRWLCFHPEQVTVEQSEVLLNGAAVSMPQMQAITETEQFEISISDQIAADYDQIFSKWQNLIASAQNVCVSLKRIQTLEPVGGRQSSLWTIKSLRSDLGEWHDADQPSND
jgi:hypothetical protein